MNWNDQQRRSATPARGSETQGIRVLFDVGHPAQVHLFRNAIRELEHRGHETQVTSRVKEETVELLDAYGIDHVVLSTRGASLPSLARELLVREAKLLRIAREFEPDVIVSRLGPAPIHVSALLGVRSVIISDTRIPSNRVRWLVHRTTLPFVDTICCPADFELPIAPERRRLLDFQELAYLHPNYFEPSASDLVRYGIDLDSPFFVLRLAGWDAYHDIGHKGLSRVTTHDLVSFLSEYGSVYISSEGPLPSDLESYRLPTPPEVIHQVLYHADLYVGDSGTMATEAAVLGTPAIRTNSMVGDGDENVFVELERQYGLLRSFSDEEQAFKEVRRQLTGGIDREVWREKRMRLVEEQFDVTETMVDIILESTHRE